MYSFLVGYTNSKIVSWYAERERERDSGGGGGMGNEAEQLKSWFAVRITKPTQSITRTTPKHPG
jgi:hypothetical protein